MRRVGLEAREAAGVLRGDLAYIDPPYNQHSYLGNYHVWESLVRWDKPEVYGKACKRVDCRERKSVFNRRADAAGALAEVLASVRCRWLLVSFSDEGFIGRAEMEGMLGRLAGSGRSNGGTRGTWGRRSGSTARAGRRSARRAG